MTDQIVVANDKPKKTNNQILDERVTHVLEIAKKVEAAVNGHPDDFEIVFAEVMRIAYPYSS